MSHRNLVGVMARVIHEAVCQDLLDGPVPFEGEPDRVRAEMVLLLLEQVGYEVTSSPPGGPGSSEPATPSLPVPRSRA